jgi:hypothetical protein
VDPSPTLYVLCQQRRHIHVGASDQDLFLILHEFIIPSTAVAHRLIGCTPPMIFCAIGGTSLAFPNEVCSLTNGLFQVSIRVRHFSFSLAGRGWTKKKEHRLRGAGLSIGARTSATQAREQLFAISPTPTMSIPASTC